MLIPFVIFTLCLIVFVIALSHLRIKLRWNRINGNDEIVMSISAIFGLVKIERMISKVDFINIQRGVQVDHRTINYHTLVKWAADFKKMVDYMIAPKEWLLQSIKQLRCEKLRWRTQIGLGDASWTAISVGGIYAVKHVLTGLISRNISFTKHTELIVIPSYNKSVFTTQLDSMFRIRLAHAIYAAIVLVIRISKTRGGIQIWRNILFKG